jgi:hypothetical protein
MYNNLVSNLNTMKIFIGLLLFTLITIAAFMWHWIAGTIWVVGAIATVIND